MHMIPMKLQYCNNYFDQVNVFYSIYGPFCCCGLWLVKQMLLLIPVLI